MKKKVLSSREARVFLLCHRLLVQLQHRNAQMSPDPYHMSKREGNRLRVARALLRSVVRTLSDDPTPLGQLARYRKVVREIDDDTRFTSPESVYAPLAKLGASLAMIIDGGKLEGHAMVDAIQVATALARGFSKERS